jgi:hypothetical protein
MPNAKAWRPLRKVPKVRPPLMPEQRLNLMSGQRWLSAASRRYQTPLQGMGAVQVEMGPPGQPGVDTLAYVGEYLELGDEDASLWAALTTSAVRRGAALAMLYHGYKRTRGDLLWSLLWAAFGYASPPVAGVISVAQGFGKPKYGPLVALTK